MNNERLFQQYCELKKKYKVNNLMDERTKVVFVLESPHVDELVNKAPVSGLSGKAMSKVLYDNEEKEALGIKLKKEFSSELVAGKGKIGVVNICSIPMQRTAYTNEKVKEIYGDLNIEDYNEFFNILEKIRVNTKPTYKDENRRNMQEIVLNDFRNELEFMNNRELLFIPCGKTAEMFFKVADVKGVKWEVMHDQPHPSFGNWYKKKYASNVRNMLESI
ncbi:hypothetical protein U8V72_11810, partial [Priestia filamentosa]|uniref:hypothetical protein n=1 Tax=Priestia filamentosa TaxID=1402861 RepID=UPI00397828C8